MKSTSNFTSNFTTSGLKGHGVLFQRKTQPVTRSNFYRIYLFEILHLISKSKYLRLSLQHQDILRKEIERSFFAWMMEKRKDGKKTTPLMKETMYKSIAEKYLALTEEDGPGLFGFLTGCSAAPVFQNVANLCVNVGGREDSSSVVRFYHTGVIPFVPHQIILSFPMPDSRPLGPFDVSKLCQSELDVMPFLELFDSRLHQSDLPSFPADSATFPPPPHSDEEVHAADSGTEFMLERDIFLQRFDNPDVARTLRKIEKIQEQFSQFFNTPSLDASLGPSVWFQSD